MKNLSLILLTAMVMISCVADVRPIAKNDLTSVRVSDDITFKYGTGQVTIPAGTYRPIMQDDEGIFYISSKKLIWSSAGYRDGGIYVVSSTGTHRYYWWDAAWPGTVVHGELSESSGVALSR